MPGTRGLVRDRPGRGVVVCAVKDGEPRLAEGLG